MVSPAVSGGAVHADLRVCAECGAVAPTERARCGVCNTAFGPLSPTVPLPASGRAWGRVEVTVPCARCGTVVGVRPDSIGAPIACGQCGASTDVDLAWWDEAFHMVHAAVDLSFPDLQGLNAPLGSFNPFAAVGVRESSIDLPCDALPSQSPLRLRVCPGAPLCQRCRNPVSVRFTAPGRLTAQCSRCGDREAFSVPEIVSQRFGSVRALMSYPPEAAAAQGRVEPWWVLIEGLSYLRPVVQENKAQAERANAERAAWESWQQQERERQAAEAKQRAEQAERDRVEREKREKAERERVERERLQGEARAGHEEADRQRAERERVEGELARMQEFHRGEMERMQREAWEQGEQARAQYAQFEQAMASERARYAALERESAERDAKSKRRWRVAMVLWALFFVAVLGDLALAVMK